MLCAFHVECLCQALRAKYKREARLDPELTRRVASRFEVRAHALHQFLQCLFDLGLYEQVADVHAKHARRHAQSTLHPAIEKLAAMALYQRGLLPEARQAFEAVLAKAPLDGEALAARHVIDRRTGVPLASLDQTLEAARRYAGTLFAAGLAKEVAASLYESGRAQEAFDLLGAQSHPARERLLQAFTRQRPGVAFDHADLSDCLVIKAGPPMVFDFLRDALLGKSGETFDLIGSFDPAAGPALTVGRAAPFPGTRYIHAAHFEALAGQLPKKRYQSCLVVMSNLDTGYYNEILALALALTAQDIYLYSFDNLNSSRFKTTLLRHQGDTSPDASADRTASP